MGAEEVVLVTCSKVGAEKFILVFVLRNNEPLVEGREAFSFLIMLMLCSCGASADESAASMSLWLWPKCGK